jgi:hypothetical protein
VINFRYHVVSLVAVMLALAVGIALGGGPLQRTPDDDSSGGDTQTLVSAQAELAQLEQGTAFADDYTDETADGVLDKALEDRAVTLLLLPGADDADATQLTEMVDRAGGTVTARAALGEKLIDVGNRQLVSELAAQMASSAEEELDLPEDISGYEQMGALMAHALVSHKAAGDDVDGTGESVLAGLTAADLLTGADDIDARGSLVLVVAGKPYGSADDRDGAGSIVSSLLSVLDDHCDGVVLAGPVASSAEDGLVGTVRADPTTADVVSTVDAVERTAGAVTAVLALREEADGRSGHYGTSEAPDGAIPGAKGD